MKKIFYLFSLVVSFAFVACEHKELCFDHAAHDRICVQVVFDWLNAPDATPESMSLYLFPEHCCSPLLYEFSDREGGMISVPAGRYRAVCMNGGTESCAYRNTERPESFEVYTREIGSLSGWAVGELPRAEGTAEERVASTPDPLWCARANNIEIAPYGEQPALIFYPEEAFCTYTVEIRNAENLSHVKSLLCTLSGLAGGFLPGMARPTSECVTHPFTAVSDGASSVTGELLTFGRPADIEATHKLTVYALYANGEKWYYTYDVTDQVRNAENPRRVHILLDGLPLPKPAGGGTGFQPGIGDWQTVYIDIGM